MLIKTSKPPEVSDNCTCNTLDMQFACDVLSTQLFKLVRAEAMVGWPCISSVFPVIVLGVAAEVFDNRSDMSTLTGQRVTSHVVRRSYNARIIHQKASFLRFVQVVEVTPIGLI